MTDAPTATTDTAAELRTAYARAVDRVVHLARTLDPPTADVPVPATPEWDVHDLLAHLAGAVSDLVASRMDGAPGPRWTARHVAHRAATSAADLAQELAAGAAAVPPAVFESPSPTPVWDLLVHEADLLEALGRPRQPQDAWRPLLVRTARFLAMRGAGDGTVVTTDGAWALGAGGRAVQLSTDDYELLRTLYSRRSRRRLATLTDDPGALEALQLFGPRDDDPEPQPGG
jgi:uncharacterized protein (TIGR03083 family)